MASSSSTSGYRANIWENPALVKVHELCVGAIPFLAKKEHAQYDVVCVREGHCESEKLPDEAWGRPMVILRVMQRPGSTVEGDLLCHCAEITSFKQTDPATHAAFRNLVKFRESIPIQQPGALPVIGEHYTLSSGRLQGPSYVKIQHVYAIPWHYFWNFWFSQRRSTTYDVRLGEESYNDLMSKLGMQPHVYEDVNSLLPQRQTKLQVALTTGFFSKINWTIPAPAPLPLTLPAKDSTSGGGKQDDNAGDPPKPIKFNPLAAEFVFTPKQ